MRRPGLHFLAFAPPGFYIARYTTVLGVFGLFSMIHIISTKNTNNAMAARQNLTGISADRTLAEALLFRPRRGRSEDPNSRQFTRSATGSHIHRFCTRNTHIAKQRSIRSSPGTAFRRPLRFTFIMDTINDNTSRVEPYKPEAYFRLP